MEQSSPTRFGKQRSAGDWSALLLLFVGFVALAVAFQAYTGTWLGLLLPLGYVIGLYASLRVEVREIELRSDAILVRTFFRTYPMPRAHVVAVHRTADGAALEVLNGNRYDVTPLGADPHAVAAAVERWMGTNDTVAPLSVKVT